MTSFKVRKTACGLLQAVVLWHSLLMSTVGLPIPRSISEMPGMEQNHQIIWERKEQSWSESLGSKMKASVLPRCGTAAIWDVWAVPKNSEPEKSVSISCHYWGSGLSQTAQGGGDHFLHLYLEKVNGNYIKKPTTEDLQDHRAK